MTKPELEKLLGVVRNTINPLFIQASEHNSSIKFKLSHVSKSYIADFTLTEIMEAMSFYRNGKGLSDIEKMQIEEGFIDHGNSPVYKGKDKRIIPYEGTKEFIRAVKIYPRKRCCSTCAFCKRKMKSGSRPVWKPFCNLYSKFLFRMNANPYKSYCDSWEYSGLEPMIWYKNGMPDNGTFLGYDNRLFNNKHAKGNHLVDEEGLPDFK